MSLKSPEPPTVPAPYRTAERAALQQEAREFAATVVAPFADELDPVKGEMPDELLRKIAEMGYFGITVPKEQGGLGLGVFEYCMISEELARVWLSAASIIARAQGSIGVNVADEARRDELMRRSARGEWIGAVALSEPGTGSDLASVSTRAEIDGDHYVLNGAKRWCGNALAADFIQVFCRMDSPGQDDRQAAGLGTLLLEKERGTFPEGVTGSPIDKIGYHGFRTWNLNFDNVRVPRENLLHPARPGGQVTVTSDSDTSGFKAVQDMLNAARVHTAARAVGLARGAVEDCTGYLQTREQFGRPIGEFQALRFTLADMVAKVHQGRAFWMQVADMIDRERPAVDEAAMVKYATTEMSVEVTNNAMQLHGGNGYTTEQRVERYWRDARLTTIFEGTSQIMQRIVADGLLGKANN